MKRIYFLCVFLFLTFYGFSQKEILVGEGKYKTDQNVEEYISGKRKLQNESSYNGKNYVLLQFKGIPTEQEKKRLKAKGIELDSYVQNNTYYARIKEGNLASQLSSSSIISIYEIKGLSKTSRSILNKNIPKHARVNDHVAKVNVVYFGNTELSGIKRFLQAHNMRLKHVAEEFNVITIDMPVDAVKELASQPWVKWIEYIDMPETLENIQGRTMNRVNILSQKRFGGRNLTGKGVTVGVWDGSVQKHPDLGNRVNVMEYERASDHGMHVSGTVAGAGIIDPRGKGMAPEAKLYTYNFGTQSNGKSAEQEMLNAANKYGVDITQNSYGVSLRDNCDYVARYSSRDGNLDKIVNQFHPTLTHVFSAGNNQSDCLPSHYSTSTKRAKNVILVGALKEDTEMSYFSSWGPMDDGRLLPHICSFGVDTYSPVYNNKYGYMSGTSMATPAVSGTISLLYQRYEQLKGSKPLASLIKAVVCNTAEDKGNAGPDYSFGYGIMNALKAVRVFEKKQFVVAEIENGKDFTFKFSVPENAVNLRVMLVWSDYFGTVSTKKALVNDLDLTLEKNGKTTMPWVLDASTPEKPAVRGIDKLNNIEQVTVQDPETGEYTVRVTGTEVPKGPQQFSVVYYYDMPELQMIYPNGNEKFEPESQVAIRWESVGQTGTQTIEFSNDNGATFTPLVKGIPNGTQDYVITMPKVVTGKALIRVIQNGTMDVCNSTFTIAPVPTKLAVTAPDCGADGWNLTWEPVEGADKYQILKADIEKGTYTQVGESTTPNFDLPSLTDGRSIFTVRSVFGDAVSERAYAVIVNSSVPLSLKAAELPFFEDFERFPSDFIKLNSKEGTNFGYTPSVFSTQQAHCIYMSGSEATEEWDISGNVFEKNPKDVISAKICQMDITGTTGDVWMRTAARMFNSGVETNANFRILADGKQLVNSVGKSVINTIESGEYIMYWNLTEFAGEPFSLEFQAALRNPTDSIQLGHIMVYQPKYDISLSALSSAGKAASLSASNDVKVKVRNNSGHAISNIPISYTINGEAAVYEVIKDPIAPFTTLEYTFNARADFSVSDKAYELVATVILDGDENEKNNTVKFSTANLGDYYLIPGTKSKSNIKKLSATGILKFTDDGAKVWNYSDKFSGSVTFEPKTAGSKVKIKFIEFDIEKDYDILEIRDGDSYDDSPVITALSGKPDVGTLEYTATNEDGKLTIVFTSDSEVNESGWLAEVTEVDASEVITDNTLTLARVSMYDDYYPDPTEIRIKVKNNSAADVENVKVQFKVNEGAWIEEESIGTIAASTEVDYEFKTLANLLPLGAKHKISVRVVNVDDNMDDNLIEKTITNDKYCFPYSASSSYSSGLFLITNVAKGDVSNPTSATEQGDSEPSYYRTTVFPMYNDLTTQLLEVEVNKYNKTGKIGVWIDWNDDGDFTNDGGVSSLRAEVGVTTYRIPITIPDGTTLGKKHMRVRATTDLALDPCEREYSSNGEVEDYMVELTANYPITVDLSVTNTAVKSGVGLSATEDIKVTISNNASQAISNFDIAYKVDGGAEVKETVTEEIAPFTTYEYTFAAKADLSAQGAHKVEIYTLATGDMVADNDKLTKDIITTVIATDGFYALNFDGKDDLVDAGTLNDINLQDFTYEAWINPKSYGGHGGEIGFGRVFQGKGAIIFLHGEGNTNYPDHSLVISVAGGSFHTIANTIDLNKWQHIAVSFEASAEAPNVYINGVKAEVTTRVEVKKMNDNSEDHLYIGNNSTLERAFKGMIDEARVWNVIRTESDIRTNLYNHVAADATGLLAQFSFDEGFYNSAVYSGAITASIKNAEVGEVDGSIWVEPTQLVGAVAYKGQVADLKDLGSGRFITEVTQVTDLKKLTADYKTTYPNVSVKINGVEQVANTTETDYSNSTATPIKVDYEATVFGENLTETRYYSVKAELSAECELKTFGFAKVNNAELSGDIIVPSITQTIILDVDASTLTTNLKPMFTLSLGAKLLVNGVELVSGNTALDFSKPILAIVEAANGRATKTYSIRLRKAQTITWTPNTNKTYGDLKFELGASSTSRSKISYTSSNTDVIRVNGSVASIVGAGSATITANQFGHNNLLAANPISKPFVVKKAELNVTADNKVVDYTLPIPELTMSYTGLVNDETVKVIDVLPEITTTAKQNDAPADYIISLTGGSDNNYNLNLTQGTLTINNVVAYNTKFKITNGSSAIAGANVKVNGQNLMSAANGEALVKLIDGTYNYVVTKDGFAEKTGSVTIAGENFTENVVLSLPLPTFTLKYETDGNGIIIGKGSQKVEKGSDGTKVVAAANAGYHFVKWSDGVTTEERTDFNVQKNIWVTSQFEINSYNVIYHAGTQGVLEGEANQVVGHGKNGVAVKAVANPGYAFTQWSDGVTENPRTEVNVTKHFDVTAVYSKVYKLPYEQPFSGAVKPVDWSNVSNLGNEYVWEFMAKSGRLTGATGSFAILDSDEYGSKAKQDADLISPIFDMTEYSSVTLKFKHYFKTWKYSKATLLYSIAGGSWVEIQSWSADTDNPSMFSEEIAAVAGKSNVRFKWNYVGSYEYYWSVDDVEITGVEIPKFTLNYTAGANGKLTGTANQTVLKGADAIAITAVANAGYHFVKWSDGVTANPRTDLNVQENATIAAEFAKTAIVTPKYTLSYTAGANGTLTGSANQTVEKGSDATAITAVANAGYYFTKWSDGVTANPRTDLNVQANMTVAAEFEKNAVPKYTVTYKAGTNGTIEGTATQTVEKGSDATAVTAVANTGFHFTKWNDGATNNPRTDLNVQSDLTITAEFAENTYKATFVVKTNGTLLSGATININNEEIITDASGQAEIALKNGAYDYSVVVSGAADFSGNIVIDGEDKVENISINTTAVDDLQIDNVKVYPNPVVNLLHIEKVKNAKRVSIRNLAGLTVRTISLNGSDRVSLDVTNLADGTYFVCIEYADGKRTVSQIVKH